MIPAHLSPVSVDGTTGMVAVVTILAALVLGLGTLARPSRATVTWGVAFAVSTLAAYLWLAGHHGHDATLRGAASGLLLSFEPLIWLGLRLHHGRRGPAWVAIAFPLVCTGVLIATAGTPWSPTSCSATTASPATSRFRWHSPHAASRSLRS